MISLKDLSFDELSSLVNDLHEPSYRTGQIYSWLFSKGISTFDEMTTLSLDLRKRLAEVSCIKNSTLKNIIKDNEGTTRYLVELSDKKQVEAVLMQREDRYTLCISTQVGCRMGCVFCLTGKKGLSRNLTQGEIIDQILLIKQSNNIKGNTRFNIVLMGMGEPLDNYNTIVGALKTMLAQDGLGISPKRITLSTCGLLPELINLGNEQLQINLAISLNAAINKTRTTLMPINRKYPLQELIKACQNYPLQKRKRITFEYILFNKINDSEEDATRLAELLKNVKKKINLIPFNGFNSSSLEPSPYEQILTFQKILMDKGCMAMIRKSKGTDIMAACGQLQANEPL